MDVCDTLGQPVVMGLLAAGHLRPSDLPAKPVQLPLEISALPTRAIVKLINDLALELSTRVPDQKGDQR
jgi:hypothetical protein